MKIAIGDNSRKNTPMIVRGVTPNKSTVLQHFLLNSTRIHGLFLLVHMQLFHAEIVTRNKLTWYFDLQESHAPVVIPTVIMDSLTS